MVPKVLTLVVAAGFVLTGCPQSSTSQPPPPVAAGGCTGAVCNVVITVTNCDPVPVPDPLNVSAANSVINWKIAPQSIQQGFTFTPTNGIVPRDDQDNQFSGHTAASPTHFHVNDKNSNRTRYKYAINVQQNGNACPTKDPSIQNGSN